MYFVLRPEKAETTVYLTTVPKVIERSYELNQGKSRAEGWPDDVVFEFSKRHKERMILTDWVRNTSSWAIVSPKFRAVLESRQLENVEYLPIKINNHKEKLASADHCIANFTRLVTAVDRDRSVFKEVAREINSFDKLSLIKQIEQDGPAMFRLQERDIMVLARVDLVGELRAAGVTGVEFVPTDKFKTLG